MKKNFLKFILPAGVLIIVGLVGWKFILPAFGAPYKTEKFELKDLSFEDAPFYWEETSSLPPAYPTDANGIIYYRNQYYHPNQLANVGLEAISSFKKTGNGEYLKIARKHADKLLEIAEETDGAFYFPYEFDFKLHDLKDDVLRAPWYSGMAQGETLSLFVRAYKQTNEKKYLDAAQKTFESFKRLDKGKPWTVYVDESNYYWIEEYPDQPTDNTLNGFIFGLYGVYDYYELSKDAQAKRVLEGGLTTLKHNLNDFRVLGGISYYCLKHQKQDEKYHKTHIKQLNQLYRLTGDEYFKTMADNFSRDH